MIIRWYAWQGCCHMFATYMAIGAALGAVLSFVSSRRTVQSVAASCMCMFAIWYHQYSACSMSEALIVWLAFRTLRCIVL